MDNSQFFVLAHKRLESYYSIEIWNINKVEIGGHESFICEKSREAKPQLERQVISQKETNY